MVSKKVLTFILRFLCGVALVLLFWWFFPKVVFAFAVGQDPTFDMGDNYIMVHRQVYYTSPEEMEDYPSGRNIIAEQVHKFAFSGPWFVGNTEKGWFAIQKKIHDVYYPLSKDELQSITGLDISLMKMETNIIPYVIARPEALAAKAKANRFCCILLVVVPLVLGFLPLVVKGLGEGKKNNSV
ncbi:MAG: hypothetical protein ACYSUY_06435 [Planctomycetota bacterium]|jgi:hypothetical protein